MKKIELILLTLFSISAFHYSRAQSSPFPLTENEIGVKIDSLERIYKAYEKQTFSSLEESDQINVMTAMGLEAILNIAPDYYREYGKPTIIIDTLKDENAWRVWASNTKLKKPIIPEKKENIGKLIYIIRFSYNTEKENLGVSYIAEFIVLKENGEPLQLFIPATMNIVPFETQSFKERMKEKVLPENRIKYAPYIPNTRT